MNQFWQHSRERFSKILHFSAPLSRDPRYSKIFNQRNKAHNLKNKRRKPFHLVRSKTRGFVALQLSLWILNGAAVDDLAPVTIWGTVGSDIISDDELRTWWSEISSPPLLRSIIGLSLSNSLFVSREKKIEVVLISLVFSLSFSSLVERLQSISPILHSPSVLGA